MERYRNKRTMFRKGNGKFRKATMQDMGIPQSLVNNQNRTCGNCGHVWFPILTTGRCPECKTELKAKEAEAGDR